MTAATERFIINMDTRIVKEMKKTKAKGVPHYFATNPLAL